MVFRFFAAALLAIVTLTSVSCVSAPQKKSADSSLILIPTLVQNSSGAAFGRKYYLQFSDGYKELLISDYQSTYLTLVVEKPGVRIVGVRSEVDKSRNYAGQPGFNKVDIPLPYEAGRLVVADVTFQLEMVRIDTQNYSSFVRPLQTTDDLRQQLFEKFRSNKANAAWFAEE